MPEARPALTLRCAPVIALAACCILTAAAVAAERQQVRGTQFVTMMNGNTLTGGTEAGVVYNLFFLTGGVVTYEDSAGTRDSGTWWIDKRDRLCVTWRAVNAGREFCYAVYIEGREIIWEGEGGGGRGTLQGTIVDSTSKP